jgi:hypothetical protein
MTAGFEYNPASSRRRRLGYFDLLGTRQLIRSGDHFQVFSVYEKAAREVTRRNARLPRIRHAWFSDTFLVYSENDTASDFGEMDAIARWFAHFLILAEIPLRGALACGDFYADSVGDWAKINGENQVMRSLSRMKTKRLETSIVRKYENTITFVQQNQRSVVASSLPTASPNTCAAEPVRGSSVVGGPPSVC